MTKLGDSKRKALIFGAGVTGLQIKRKASDFDVIGFIDNDPKKNGKQIEGLPIFSLPLITEDDYDEIIVAVVSGFDAVVNQLVDSNVPKEKINTEFLITPIRARENFVYEYAALVNDLNVPGAIAEGGVFRGDFSKVLKVAFPRKEIYLFDTFCGFPESSISTEDGSGTTLTAGHLAVNSISDVLQTIGDTEKCHIRKGIFPRTTVGLEDEVFTMVSLDFDLFQPTLEGLRFFCPRMAENGLILIHDYFNSGYPGVRSAVKLFLSEEKTRKRFMPIGDSYSIALMN